MYTVQQIMDVFSFGSPGFIGILISFAIANTIGLLEYFWAVALNVKEHKTPFPAWMHTFFFAHDFTAGVVFLTLAVQNDFFWLFVVYGGGMCIWTVLEFINMRTVVLYEREEWFGRNASVHDAVIGIILQVAVMFCIVNWFRYLTNDVAMFYWLPMTNFVMAVGPGYVLYKRQSREGSSMFVYIMIVAGTVFNFLPAPIGLFTTALPQTFNQPIWFVLGAVCVVVSVYNLYRFSKLPAKTADMGDYKHGKPIW